MSHSNRTRSIPFIFEKPLSKVRMGRSYRIPVAAIKASANDILLFCFRSIAMSLISRLYDNKRQSSKSALQLFVCDVVIPGIPSDSISVTKETANNFFVYEESRASPSNKLIRMFVSARKSIFTSCFLLVFQAVQPSLQCPEVFPKRRFFFPFFNLDNAFSISDRVAPFLIVIIIFKYITFTNYLIHVSQLSHSVQF